MLDSHLIVKTNAKANDKQCVVIGNLRFTVILPTVLRVEKSFATEFNDDATQIVWHRDCGEYEYAVKDTANGYDIVTEKVSFHYNLRLNLVTSVTAYGKDIPLRTSDNLKGTARTLDMAFGAVPLNDGVIGKQGVSSMPDNSLLLKTDGTISTRKPIDDRYYFACESHRDTLKAFYALTGKPPMVPRYALGNWWSRYWAYTQSEYIDLMNKFEQKNIPITVATIDMDWHWVQLKKEFKSTLHDIKPNYNGWTGYSWNSKLFPDYKGMLKELKAKNLAITLNLHPAEGIRSYEDAYKDMCLAIGQNPDEKDAVQFDITTDAFWNGYFNVLHKPYENDGVDFWWIDWQQGKKSSLVGYDPLWALNHYHTLDNAIGKRPLILSRYAGLGSHRYPLGFSGDSAVTWKMLDFEPYFTANASNCGYTAWSHDIGGHHLGHQKDDELYLRWLQFGVFSPALRLHSTKTALSKEPWNHKSVENMAIDFLRLRHSLIPYIYNGYYENYINGRALCEPLYYTIPDIDRAKYCNEYFFGSELLVYPITRKSRKGKSIVTVYLPQGKWTNFFDKQVYNGGQELTLTYGLDSMPVFIKEGGIIPLSLDEKNTTVNPLHLALMVADGDSSYTMYEDDGVTDNYKDGVGAVTIFKVSDDGNRLCWTAEGDIALLPKLRDYTVEFVNRKALSNVKVRVNGIEFIHKTIANKVELEGIKNTDKVEINILNQ